MSVASQSSRWSDQEIEQIKQSFDIADVVRSFGIGLKKTGSSYKACCPFHNDSNPSFTVSSDFGTYKCWSCGAQGDVIDFVKNARGVSFYEAIKELSGGRKPSSTFVPRKVVVDSAPRIVVGEYWTTAPRTNNTEMPVLKNGFSALNSSTYVSMKIYNHNEDDKGRTGKVCCLSHVTKAYRYADFDNNTNGYVLRCEYPELNSKGKRRKSTFAVAWVENLPVEKHISENRLYTGWAFTPPGRPTLPYGVDRLIEAPTATRVWFEGEKSADAGHRLLKDDNFVGLGWCGGTEGVHRFELMPAIAAGDHILCPDNDDPGLKCMEVLMNRLRAAGCEGKITIVTAPEGAKPGWDIADSLEADSDEMRWSSTEAVSWLVKGAVEAADFFVRNPQLKKSTAQSLPAGTSSNGNLVVLPTAEVEFDMDYFTGDDHEAPVSEVLDPLPAEACDEVKSLLVRRETLGNQLFLNDFKVLGIVGRLKKDRSSGYEGLRKQFRAVGLNVTELETRADMVGRGLTYEALEVYNSISNGIDQDEFYENEQIVNSVIRIKGTDDKSFKELRNAVRAMGWNLARFDTHITLAANRSGEVMDGYDEAIFTALKNCKISLRFLGYQDGNYYYLSSVTDEVTVLTADQHTKSGSMLQLATLNFWRVAFSADGSYGSGVDWVSAGDWMMTQCRKAGIYDSNKLRGRGVWFDEGRTVVHLGKVLIIDGQQIDLQDYDGKYIYARKLDFPMPLFNNPLTDDEGTELLDIFNMLRFNKPMSAVMLAGWVAGAMICGSLDWRPHAWLTGESGSGKTWAHKNIIQPLLEGIALPVSSSTSEAGIRQSLHIDALPVLFDEAEAEDMRAQARIQGVLELGRVASSDSGGDIRKGTAGGKSMIFRLRSMFFMSSVAVSLKHQADMSRFMIFKLLPPDSDKRDQQAQEFSDLQDAVFENIKKDTSQRLFARLIQMIPTIRTNVQTFTTAAANVMGSQRAGDQVGVVLACAWALQSRDLISMEAAVAWIDSIRSEIHNDERDRDQDVAKHILTTHQLRIELAAGGAVTRNVAELIEMVARKTEDEIITEKMAVRALGNMGLKVIDNGLCVHNSLHTLSQIFESAGKPQWSSGWNEILSRLTPEARPFGNNQRFSSGVAGRSLWIPLSAILVGEDDQDGKLVQSMLDADLTAKEGIPF